MDHLLHLVFLYCHSLLLALFFSELLLSSVLHHPTPASVSLFRAFFSKSRLLIVQMFVPAEAEPEPAEPSDGRRPHGLLHGDQPAQRLGCREALWYKFAQK
jgi:hypothetical protein